jgi:hypothetical protein
MGVKPRKHANMKGLDGSNLPLSANQSRLCRFSARIGVPEGMDSGDRLLDLLLGPCVT